MKRFNWIDILIVVILVAAIGLVIFKMAGGDPQTLGAENQLTAPNLRIEVVCEKVTPETAQNIVASLESEPRMVSGIPVEKTRLFNSNNLVDASITAWEILPSEEEWVYLRFTIEANAILSSGSYSIGTQEIRIGRGFTAKTMDIEIGGIITVMTELQK